MAKFNVTVKPNDIDLAVVEDLSFDANIKVNVGNLGIETDIPQTAVLHIKDLTGIKIADANASIDIAELISNDPENDLHLGSDNKLHSKPEDFDFLAFYLLS